MLSVPSISKEVLALGHHIELESKNARKENSPEHLRILRRIQSLEKCGRLNDNGGKGCDCSKYIAKGSLISEIFQLNSNLKKRVPNYYPRHYPPKEKILRVVIWYLFSDIGAQVKNFL